jgi:type II secretion system protein I
MRREKGFTFIEVMVAMLIFVLAVLAAVNIVRGAVRATRETREITIANWLLQNVISELEIKLETEGLDKACDKKTEGKFDDPYGKYQWVTECYEIDFEISETAAKMAQAMQNPEKSEDDLNSENAILKMVLDTANTYIKGAMREIHAEVLWVEGKNKRKVEVTTHFARYDNPLSVPGRGSAPSGSGGGSSTGGNP